jgi:hypothetical protein
MLPSSSTGDEEQVLKIHRNIYGQKQAGRVRFQYLKHKLINELKFTQSKIDECVFYRGKTLYVYTDDSLLAGPDNNEIEQIIKDLKKAKLEITDEGDCWNSRRLLRAMEIILRSVNAIGLVSKNNSI